jgi:UDP-galactopyranose mutase
MSDLICFSHIRWDSMQNQAQYLPSRLSRQRRMLYVEEALCKSDVSEPHLEFVAAASPHASKVIVVRLIYPGLDGQSVAHDDSLVFPVYSQLLSNYLTSEGYRDPILWLYTPKALDYANAIQHKLLVYDAVEQRPALMSSVDGAADCENSLLTRANIVIHRRRQAVRAGAEAAIS